MMMAVRWPARSDPAKSQLPRPRAVFREVALHDAAIPADEDGIHHLADEGLVGGSGA
jgi:hypothetical protein